eukprot:262923-Karenia_brevis.AAC.1
MAVEHMVVSYEKYKNDVDKLIKESKWQVDARADAHDYANIYLKPFEGTLAPLKAHASIDGDNATNTL